MSVRNTAGLARIGKKACRISVIALLIGSIRCGALISAAGAAEDEWFGPDKIVHAAISAAVSFAAYAILRKNTDFSKNQSMLTAFGVSVSAGFIKETIDERFSEKDLAADILGAGAGIGAAVTCQF